MLQKMEQTISTYQSAVDVIKNAILQSQARAAKAVNQEQLALYYGIGRYVSENTRKNNWGSGAIETISARLRQELPGLRGFSATSIKYMRIFFEEWQIIEARNSSVASDEFTNFNNLPQVVPSNEIRQLELANLQDFPLKEFLSISFSHHIAILTKVKSYDERVFYIKYADTNKVSVDGLEKVMKQDLFHHQDKMPNNFLATIPDYKKAYRAISMFKDEYLLDFINVEEIGLRDSIDVDERVVEKEIVGKVKNFIMTIGHDFTFMGNQQLLEVYGVEHFPDLLFFNRELNAMVVVELKMGEFKTSYLRQFFDERSDHKSSGWGI